MKGWMVLVVAAGMVVGCGGARADSGKAEGAPAVSGQAQRPRVGVYDARAVAVAFVASKANAEEMAGKMAEMKQAKEKGDAKRVAELEAWGKARQARLHLQGFAGTSVDDLLERVGDGVARVGAGANVDAVVRKGEFVSDRAEQVDVTDEVVKLFGEPSERTRKWIEDLKKQPPADRGKIEAAEKAGKF